MLKRTEELKAKGKPLPEQGPERPFYAGGAFEAPDVADDDLLDGDTACEAVAALRALARKPDQPFFLAVGFANPHVPWVAPKKYWELYNPADLKRFAALGSQTRAGQLVAENAGLIGGV